MTSYITPWEKVKLCENRCSEQNRKNDNEMHTKIKREYRVLQSIRTMYIVTLFEILIFFLLIVCLLCGCCYFIAIFPHVVDDSTTDNTDNQSRHDESRKSSCCHTSTHHGDTNRSWFQHLRHNIILEKLLQNLKEALTLVWKLEVQ